MTYKNAFIKYIAQQKVMSVPQPRESKERDNDFATSYDIHLQVESSVMRHSEVHGGNGYAAATVGDLGYEPTLGATPADAKPARRRTKAIEVGEGLSAAGVSVAGVSVAGASADGLSSRAAKRIRRKKGEGAPC